MPSAFLLAHIEMWVAELEREVQAFEEAVEEVEEAMQKSEQAGEQQTGQIGPQMRRLGQLGHALERARHLAELVEAANATLGEAIDAAHTIVQNEHLSLPAEENFPALAPGKTILDGRYRIIELLHARPRVNLYLAYRLAGEQEQARGAPVSSPVAIRELLLAGLPPAMQALVEQAAFEEYVAPGMFGSPRLPGVGDRVAVECERHYLVMQLRPVRNERAGGHAVAVSLAELLLNHQRWPAWLDMPTALDWGVQLCRIVARLHRMGVILGDLDPATILVDSNGPAAWVPVLLVSWPPAMQFWPDAESLEHYRQLFPAAENLPENPFAAPETLSGQADLYSDQRSDIYSLGALLYLLFTRYAPIAAALRQPAELPNSSQNGLTTAIQNGQGIALVPPRLFNPSISQPLELLLTRALALRPGDRFSTVFELVETLEAIDPAQLVDRYSDKLINARKGGGGGWAGRGRGRPQGSPLQ